MPEIPAGKLEQSHSLPAAEDHSSSEPMAVSTPIQLSMAYLTIADSVSVRAAYPYSPRKLLILDLNGTLLIRPKPRGVAGRPIHPRPYMPAFRSYIFHETVKPWLEVMVWSSAQPHNVDEMVDRCFGDRREELKAVWARDTLGLAAHDYFRKVQTVKDLEKCWSNLTDTSPSHTAETTLLIDDSARKAHLQPYSHIPVPEYTQNLRNRDLSTKLHNARLSKKADQTYHLFDPTLIALVGVLDEIKEQTNVAGWIRADRLWSGYEPPRADCSSFELFADDKKDGIIETERGTPCGSSSDVASSQVWFDHQPCFQYWVDRGKRVVKALGIKLDHGVVR
ncbi:hypothetical protein JB92DRAFT_2788887 [Gautieria morchelliformis]|nr:hypothetical protein JB92DRAFT_2788887 [Gautieria morchelliformis]